MNMSLIWQKISLKDLKKGGDLPPLFSFDSFQNLRVNLKYPKEPMTS